MARKAGDPQEVFLVRDALVPYAEEMSAGLWQQARGIAGPAVAVTFDPHPLQLLRPERFMPVLTTMPDRVVLLQSTGADHVLIGRAGGIERDFGLLRSELSRALAKVRR